MENKIDKDTVDKAVEIKADPDWCQALDNALTASDNPLTGEVKEFTVDDIVEVVVCSAGERNVSNWTGIFRTRDGDFVYISSWNDDCGDWGRSDGGFAEWHQDLETLKTCITISHSDRTRLGLLNQS